MSKMGNGGEKVLVISPKESFLANGLVTKLDTEGVSSVISRGNIKEIAGYRDETDLMVLFMGEESEEYAELLVYIRDMAVDMDRRIILIGESEQYDAACNVIPETFILKWFKRPLVMDELIKAVLGYMDENTGEKKKKTVLIVDDDVTYMRMVYEWLKDKYHVGMAASGIQAISYLTKNNVDLVLLDYEMPVADGPQVLSMLRSDSQTDQIPVMFLTGHSDRDSVLSVVSLSPADYLLKTIDKKSLLEKLDKFFGQEM